MYYKIVSILLVISACGPLATPEIVVNDPPQAADGVDGKDGVDGVNGQDGINGYSLVSQSRAATNIECAAGGSAVDIYKDLDRNGAVTPGDIFQSGLLACNGTNGNNATGSVTAYIMTNTTACFNIGHNLSIGKNNSTTSNVRVWTNSFCAGGHVNEMSEGGDEVFMIYDNVLLVLEGSNSSSTSPLTLRKIVFNL